MGLVSCYWITGLPAAGKSTLAKSWVRTLQERDVRAVCLDGDELRKGLCRDLGLSDSDRAENIRRAGEVARLMADAGLTVVCAFVSPFEADRQKVRALFQPEHFAEIHLTTSLDECIRRDPKGLYARAKAGELTGLTGWDAPYETPRRPEFTFDTQAKTVEQMVRELWQARDGNPSHEANGAAP